MMSSSDNRSITAPITLCSPLTWDRLPARCTSGITALTLNRSCNQRRARTCAAFETIASTIAGSTARTSAGATCGGPPSHCRIRGARHENSSHHSRSAVVPAHRATTDLVPVLAANMTTKRTGKRRRSRPPVQMRSSHLDRGGHVSRNRGFRCLLPLLASRRRAIGFAATMTVLVRVVPAVHALATGPHRLRRRPRDIQRSSPRA